MLQRTQIQQLQLAATSVCSFGLYELTTTRSTKYRNELFTYTSKVSRIIHEIELRYHHHSFDKRKRLSVPGASSIHIVHFGTNVPVQATQQQLPHRLDTPWFAFDFLMGRMFRIHLRPDALLLGGCHCDLCEECRVPNFYIDDAGLLRSNTARGSCFVSSLDLQWPRVRTTVGFDCCVSNIYWLFWECTFIADSSGEYFPSHYAHRTIHPLSGQQLSCTMPIQQ